MDNKMLLSLAVLFTVCGITYSSTITAACDNEMKIYADGVLIGTANVWENALNANVPSNTEVLAIDCKNTGGPCGLIVSSDDGFETDDSWVCSGELESGWNTAGFNDDSWSSPQLFGAYGVAPWTTRVNPTPTNGQWIASTSGCATGAHSYCRKTKPRDTTAITAACDNEMIVYADGVQIGQSADWKQAQNLNIHTDTRVLAIDCKNTGGPCGMIVSSVAGFETGSNWKCSGEFENGWNSANFNDKQWAAPQQFGTYGVAPWNQEVNPSPSNGQWIASTSGCAKGAHSYCRLERQTVVETDTLTLTCDNEMKAYVDGQFVAESKVWEEAIQLDIDSYTQVVAVECKNTGGPCGLISKSNLGYTTDDSWKCSSNLHDGWTTADFDDSDWDAPNVFGAYGVDPWNTRVNPSPAGGQWIASQAPCATGQSFYCRKARVAM